MFYGQEKRIVLFQLKIMETIRDKKYSGVLLIGVLIFLVYNNTFHASWHLDDYPNIINNTSLHIKDLSYKSITKSFYTEFDGQKRFYRPLACMTLAINWYFGQDSTKGYHVVNVLIHFITASILFITILNLFKTPKLKKDFAGNEYFVALFAVVLWAINPIQVQAVTYIVQRMASLAAMFYIISIYFYIKARISISNRFFFYFCCFTGFLFAMASKENAATLPLALLLIEIIFFSNLKLFKTRKLIVLYILVTIVIFFSIYCMIFKGKDTFSFFLNGYEHRPFNLIQRLLTSPRLIVFYLTQIFYPAPYRFSIKHDIDISTSLFEPWTTLPSILLIIILIYAGVVLVKRKPLISFAILFFFLNHIIESTILPLELIFEHRNYLPSFFLFLPLAVFLKVSIDHYQQRRFMKSILVLFTIFLIIGFGIGTYIRNMAWSTEKSLWEDVQKKHPTLAAPYQILAQYYQNQNQDEKALGFYYKAISLKSQQPKRSLVVSLNNIGNIYTKNQDYQKAINFYMKVLEIYPENERGLYNLTLALIKLGKLQEASEKADILLSQYYYHAQYLNIKGFILLKQGRYKEALTYLKHALHIAPTFNYPKINIGATLSLMGYYNRAEWFFKLAYQAKPDEIIINLCLIENSIRSDDGLKTNFYLERLFDLFSIKRITSTLEELSQDDTSTTVSFQLLVPVISAKLFESAQNLSKVSKKDIKLNFLVC
ncbi:tetratricopeptide repeat protein [Desulfobacula sp.]|uniref:tetratricopeptide repeat protein n=1 Tax=Desulfobacula sp. TaxID=2593537 RepID=UPI0025C3F69E|nr:tetratricopeptide repeat protein [Desulfobacula sp.]